MDQTPILPKNFHRKMSLVFFLLFIFDLCYFFHALRALLVKSPSMMILFAFEVKIMIFYLITV